MVDVDGRRMRQAVDNLVENAIRAARTTIQLRGAVTGYTVTITVDDDGHGFPADATDVFADHDTTERGGLGLAIVGLVVQAHCGEVRAGDSPEGGARVTITLPSAARQTPLASSHAE
jgi:signal transduction histidine kinase